MEIKVKPDVYRGNKVCCLQSIIVAQRLEKMGITDLQKKLLSHLEELI